MDAPTTPVATVSVSTTPSCAPDQCKAKGDAGFNVILMGLALVVALLIVAAKARS